MFVSDCDHEETLSLLVAGVHADHLRSCPRVGNRFRQWNQDQQVQAAKSAGTSASGVVRMLDRPNSRIELDHGSIPSIGMPAMTMAFKVKNPALLDRVKPGDRVTFELERSGLGWIITNLERDEQSKR